MYIWWICTPPQVIQDANTFVSSLKLYLQIYHYIIYSPVDPLWMGAVRMRVQTVDKNIKIIHTTPVHQLKHHEVKSCICNKQMHL